MILWRLEGIWEKDEELQVGNADGWEKQRAPGDRSAEEARAGQPGKKAGRGIRRAAVGARTGFRVYAEHPEQERGQGVR